MKNNAALQSDWRRWLGDALIGASVMLLMLSTGEATADLSYVLLILSSVVLTGPVEPLRTRSVVFSRQPSQSSRSGRSGYVR